MLSPIDAVTSPSLPTSAIPAPFLPGAHGVQACPWSTEQPQLSKLCYALHTLPDAFYPEIISASTQPPLSKLSRRVWHPAPALQLVSSLSDLEFFPMWFGGAVFCSVVFLFVCWIVFAKWDVTIGHDGTTCSYSPFPSRVYETLLFSKIFATPVLHLFLPCFPLTVCQLLL